MTRYAHLAELKPLVGREIGRSDWVVITQERIDAFARATDDRQWIHVDPARAAEGPYGATIAHGFLTLSLLSHLGETALQIDDVRIGVNYGLDRVRFPAPVTVGSRLRAHFVLREYREIEGGAQLAVEATLEIEGGAKPACVALALSRRIT